MNLSCPYSDINLLELGASITVLFHRLRCLSPSTLSPSPERLGDLRSLHSYVGTMALDVSVIALEHPSHLRASLEKDDCVNGKQPQLLMKFQVVSKLSRSPPTLSTFSCLGSDSDAVLMGRLHSHYKRLDTYSKRSAIIRLVLMRKLTLGFATYQVRVCPISHVFGLLFFPD